jgi:hypothetical protein
MKRLRPENGLIARYGRLFTSPGGRFMEFIMNMQPDEAWAKFALAEAMEELRATATASSTVI